MMTWRILLIPILSAVLGWVINSIALHLILWPLKPRRVLGITFQGMIFQYKQVLVFYITELLTSDPVYLKEIESRLVSRENFLKIMPVIETHIDYFLRVKLKSEMPVISSFIGEKTITQLKILFINELDELFPVVMSNYIKTLQTGESIGFLLSKKLAGIPNRRVKDLLTPGLQRLYRPIKIYGAISGLLIGLVQLILLIVYR